MASIFAHGFVAYAFGKNFSKTVYSKKLWLLGILCTILPDADVLVLNLVLLMMISGGIGGGRTL